MATPFVAPTLKCPACGNTSRTTACRFCGISLLGKAPGIRPRLDPAFAAAGGGQGVFCGTVEDRLVLGTVAPPRPA